jgi:hypothetical protein
VKYPNGERVKKIYIIKSSTLFEPLSARHSLFALSHSGGE